jgi:cyanophycin synthetase
VLRLDIAGVDLLIPDITRSWQDSGALICEVNAQPQLGAASYPDAYIAVLNSLVVEPRRARIMLVIGTELDLVSAALSRRLSERELENVVFTSEFGVWRGRQKLTGKPSIQPAMARAAIMTNAAHIIFLATPQDIRRWGLPVQTIDIVVCFDASEDLLAMVRPHGLNWIDGIISNEQEVLALSISKFLGEQE